MDNKNKLSYKKAGVDIDIAEATKRDMAKSLETSNLKVLNKIGAFAALFDASFPEYQNPVLVLKTEEPGSKQLLAFQHNRISAICYDMVNHLINDIAMMGAQPLSVQDAIICGKLEKEAVNQIVDSISNASKEQGCVLTGGETSEQPGVLQPGVYILTASGLGIVEKSKIIDGSRIRDGDLVLAVASNGLHTNGYSLVRALMAAHPEIRNVLVNGESFIDVILKPHKCYYQSLKGLFDLEGLHGLAHITGGGIEGNLNRILPNDLEAIIDLEKIRILPIFKVICEYGNVDDRDMLRTFNMGVGITVVADKSSLEKIQNHLSEKGCESYLIGHICRGEKRVVYRNRLAW